MAVKHSSNNVQAGLFLIFGVLLAVAISFVLSGLGEQFQSRKNYTVLLSLREGADGIKPGSQVLVGGQPAGLVKEVALGDDPDLAEKLCVRVSIALRSDLTLMSDALVFVERPLLGSLAKLNISSLGGESGKPGVHPLAQGDIIRGRIAPPAFLAQAGYGEEQQGQLKSIFKDAKDAMANISQLVDRNDEKIDSIISDTGTVVKDVKDATPAVLDDVKATTANARQASEKIGPILDKVDGAVDDGRALVKNADGLITENRPKVSEFMDKANSIATKIDQQGVDKAISAIDTFNTTLSEISAIIREESPSVRKALANARIASDQLKLAITEVRSQPWRVFYQPTRKELESSVLYDAARSYATAVSDLRAASESLEAAMSAPARGESPVFERQTIGELNTRLRDAFTNYATAEKALLEKLMNDGGQSAKTPPSK